ncbi:MAG TPA: ABC transporter permease [Nitrososphaerales archaeon]|nr:ABC transporter permease [Nitrososphaerales archaeon]
MRPTDLFRFSTKALTERKLKAVLTIVGIMIGPATIVSLVGATQGYTNAATGRFADLGATTVFVSPVGRGSSLTSADLPSIQGLPGVSYVLPYIEISGQLTQGTQTLGVNVIAADLTQLQKVLPTLSLSQGTLPLSSDQVGAVVGYSVAYPGIQGATNLTLSQVLTLSNVGRSAFGFGFASGPSSGTSTQRSFVVTGIYSKFGQGFGINPDTSVFIPLSAGQLISHSQSYSGVMVVASSSATVSQVVTEITNLYGSTVRVTSISSLLSSIESVTSGTTTLLEAVAGTSVLVAFIGIMTTMLTSVIERTKEIGILKALGTTSRGIMLTFIMEALVTGVAGGVMGAAVGVGLSYVVISLLSRSTLALGAGGGGGGFGGGGFAVRSGAGGGASFSAAPAASSTTLSIAPAISPEVFAAAVLLAVAVAAFGGLIPAWRASRMNPVEALRRS